MITFDNDPVVTEALAQWRSRSHFPTELSSADLRAFSRELRMRSVFSARMTNAHAVQRLQEVLDDMLSGKSNLATARFDLMREIKCLGYDPMTGFPQDMADVPPAERDSIRDLSSEARIDLMLETNMRVASNYGRVVAGNGEYARYAYPAWELVRLYTRTVERGTPKSRTAGWNQRWSDAGDSTGWIGAIDGPMVALKDAPIWQALGDGAGGYEDTLGNPFPPFAFGSGMAFRAVPRAEAKAFGLLDGNARPEPMQAQMAPDTKEVAAAFLRLSPELQAELRRELAA